MIMVSVITFKQLRCFRQTLKTNNMLGRTNLTELFQFSK